MRRRSAVRQPSARPQNQSGRRPEAPATAPAMARSTRGSALWTRAASGSPSLRLREVDSRRSLEPATRPTGRCQQLRGVGASFGNRCGCDSRHARHRRAHAARGAGAALCCATAEPVRFVMPSLEGRTCRLVMMQTRTRPTGVRISNPYRLARTVAVMGMVERGSLRHRSSMNRPCRRPAVRHGHGGKALERQSCRQQCQDDVAEKRMHGTILVSFDAAGFHTSLAQGPLQCQALAGVPASPGRASFWCVRRCMTSE
jgi:hypothetical protein